MIICYEISWLVKPTNNSRTSPSFVFDFLVCKVETSKDYSKVKSTKSFVWAEIKTGKPHFSAGQYKAMSKITLPLAIFHIYDVLKAPEDIEMKWNIKPGKEWLHELEPIDNEIYEFANIQAVR